MHHGRKSTLASYAAAESLIPLGFLIRNMSMCTKQNSSLLHIFLYGYGKA